MKRCSYEILYITVGGILKNRDLKQKIDAALNAMAFGIPKMVEEGTIEEMVLKKSVETIGTYLRT